MIKACVRVLFQRSPQLGRYRIELTWGLIELLHLLSFSSFCITTVYHWTKYVKKSVSVLGYGYQIENWGQSDNGTVHLEKIMDNPFEGRPKPRFKVWQQCVKFICDVVHFSGTENPG